MSILDIAYALISSLLTITIAVLAYNFVIFLSGYGALKSMKHSINNDPAPNKFLKISLILPAKNEELVIERSLSILTGLNYPKNRYEVAVIEDGTNNITREICEKYAKTYPDLIKHIRETHANGKPSALNQALKNVDGEIIGTFDADSIPDKDVLIKVSNAFQNGTQILQGSLFAIRSDHGILANLRANEHDAWNITCNLGKKRLGLFVPLTGSCQFIKRDLLADLHGWTESSLTEDMDLSLKALSKGISIDYEIGIKCLEEAPATVKAYLIQRIRWFRGWIELIPVSMTKSILRSKKSLDSAVTLLNNLVIALSPFIFVWGILYSPSVGLLPPFWLITGYYWILTIFTVLYLPLIGLSLSGLVKMPWYQVLVWLPVLYAYWLIQGFVALFSLLQNIVKWPKKWERTPKKGHSPLQ